MSWNPQIRYEGRDGPVDGRETRAGRSGVRPRGGRGASGGESQDPLALEVFSPGEPVWLGLDVGGSRAETALTWIKERLNVGCAIWEGDEGILHALEMVRRVGSKYTTREFPFDPWRAQQAALELEREGRRTGLPGLGAPRGPWSSSGSPCRPPEGNEHAAGAVARTTRAGMAPRLARGAGEQGYRAHDGARPMRCAAPAGEIPQMVVARSRGYRGGPWRPTRSTKSGGGGRARLRRSGRRPRWLTKHSRSGRRANNPSA